MSEPVDYSDPTERHRLIGLCAGWVADGRPMSVEEFDVLARRLDTAMEEGQAAREWHELRRRLESGSAR